MTKKQIPAVALTLYISPPLQEHASFRRVQAGKKRYGAAVFFLASAKLTALCQRDKDSGPKSAPMEVNGKASTGTGSIQKEREKAEAQLTQDSTKLRPHLDMVPYKVI